jgi:hypothetical protein
MAGWWAGPASPPSQLVVWARRTWSLSQSALNGFTRLLASRAGLTNNGLVFSQAVSGTSHWLTLPMLVVERLAIATSQGEMPMNVPQGKPRSRRTGITTVQYGLQLHDQVTGLRLQRRNGM